MADTIEAFVAKLQQEGVQAGQKASQELLAKARKEADEIIAQANAKAKKIVADAEAQAAGTLAKSRTDVQLAARDTALRLREALSRAIRAILAAGAKKELADPAFLSRVLEDIINQYVRANLEEKAVLRINVTPEMQQKLAGWAIQCLREKPEGGHLPVDLTGTLAEAGFEYQTNGANVEVTLTSVVDALSDLVSPTLREMLEQAMAEPKK